MDTRGAPVVALGRQLVRGTLWMSVGINGANGLAVLVTVVLSRLLAPGDFGLAVVTTVIPGLYVTLVNLGIGGAVVQHRDMDQAALSTIHWVVLAVSVASFAALYAAAPAVARVYHLPAATAGLRASGASLILIGAATVPTAILRRQLRFGALALVQPVAVVAGGMTGVALAVAGVGYWALIGQGLAAAVARTAIAWAWCGWRPSVVLRPRSLARIAGYSGTLITTYVVNFVGRNMDGLLIGRVLGAGALGFYALGHRLIGAPIQLLSAGVQPLLHPTLAAMGDDAVRQRRAYLQIVQTTGLISFPLGAALWLLAAPLVAVVAGVAWQPSAAIVRALALVAAVQPINALSGSVAMARGASRIMVQCALIGVAAIACGVAAGLPFGAAGVAWGYSIAYVAVAAPISSALIFTRLLGGRSIELVRALARPAQAGASVIVVGVLATRAASLAAGSAIPTLVAALAMLTASIPFAWSTVGSLLRAFRARPGV